MPTEPMQNFFDKKQVALMLNVSMPKLNAMVRQNRISYSKFGGSVRFLQKDIDEYITDCYVAKKQ